LKDPHYLTFRPAFHWTDQKLRVHAFYCVLALLMLNLLRRKARTGRLPLSIAKMMDSLTDIHEYAPLPRSICSRSLLFEPSWLTWTQPSRQLVKTLGLERYRSP